MNICCNPNIYILAIEVESYQKMVSSKESEINALKIELQKNQDNLLTTEKKTSQDFGVQFDFTVPTTGEYGNHQLFNL